MESAIAVVSGSGEPEQLAKYIRSLPGFEIRRPGGKYDHVGATLANAVLQSNNNYDRNVRPRIKRILEEYGSETSLRDLKRLLDKITAQEFLRWNGTRKPKTFLDLVDLLWQEDVNTEDDLRRWFQRDDSKAKLLKIPFVGQKTVNYLGNLVRAEDSAAMDRHLIEFLERAGIGKLNYERGQEVVHRTADLMKLDRAQLDHSIWRYMSGGKTAVQDGMPSAPKLNC